MRAGQTFPLMMDSVFTTPDFEDLTKQLIGLATLSRWDNPAAIVAAKRNSPLREKEAHRISRFTTGRYTDFVVSPAIRVVWSDRTECMEDALMALWEGGRGGAGTEPGGGGGGRGWGGGGGGGRGGWGGGGVGGGGGGGGGRRRWWWW